MRTHKHIHTDKHTIKHTLHHRLLLTDESLQTTETWRDDVIVVTLVYGCLSIHLTAHVSVFKEMKIEMEVWPLADCLNPSFSPFLSHSTSTFLTLSFPHSHFSLLPFPPTYLVFFFFCHLLSHFITSLMQHWEVERQGFLYLASLCEQPSKSPSVLRHFEIVNK